VEETISAQVMFHIRRIVVYSRPDFAVADRQEERI
jgi:hypothetical protein